MDDLQSLWLVLIAIYLAECAVWIRRDSVALANWGGWRFSIWGSGSLLSNDAGGLALANPLPAFGQVYLVHVPTLSLSPEAAFSFNTTALQFAQRPPQVGRYIPFAEIKSVDFEGRRVFVNGSLFWKAESAASARQWARRLLKLKDLPKQKRESALRQHLEDSFAVEEVKLRYQEYRRQAKPIRLLASLLFVYLFGLAPLLLWPFGMRSLLGWLAVGMLAQTSVIAFLFYRAHQSLYPKSRGEWFTPVLTMILAAPSAIRAPDGLARHLFQQFHPLAVAQALCSRETYQEFARRLWVDSHYPLRPGCPTLESAPLAAAEYYQRVQREVLGLFMQETGLNVEAFLQPPPKSELQNQAFCPRCQAQFVKPKGACADCGGQPLVSYSRPMK